MFRLHSAKEQEVLPKKVIQYFQLMKMPHREASFVQSTFQNKINTEQFQNYLQALSLTSQIYLQYIEIYDELRQLNTTLQNVLVQSQPSLTFQELCLKFSVFSDLFLKHADLNLQLQQLTSLAPLTLPGFVSGVTLMDNFTYTRQQMDNLMMWTGYMDNSRIQKWYEQRLAKFPERRTIMELQLGCSGDRFIEMFHFYVKNRIQAPPGPLLSKEPDYIRNQCLKIFMTRRPTKPHLEPGEQIMRVFIGNTWKIPKKFKQGDVCGYTIDERAYKMQQHQLKMDKEHRAKQQQLLLQMMTVATAPKPSQNSARSGGIFSKRVSVRPSGINALGEREKREMKKKQKTIEWIMGATRVTPQQNSQSANRQPSGRSEHREQIKSQQRQQQENQYENNYQHFLNIQQAMQNQEEEYDEYDPAQNFIQEDEDGSFDTSDIEEQQKQEQQQNAQQNHYETVAQSTQSGEQKNPTKDEDTQHINAYQNIIQVTQQQQEDEDDDDEFDEESEDDNTKDNQQYDNEIQKNESQQKEENKSLDKQIEQQSSDEFDENSSESQEQDNNPQVNNYQIISNVKNSSGIQIKSVESEQQSRNQSLQQSKISNQSHDSEEFDTSESKTQQKDQQPTEVSKQTQEHVETVPDIQNNSTKSNFNMTSEPEVSLEGIVHPANDLPDDNNQIDMPTNEQQVSIEIVETKNNEPDTVNYEIIQQNVITQQETIDDVEKSVEYQPQVEIDENAQIVQQEKLNAYQVVQNVNVELQEDIQQKQKQQTSISIQSQEVEMQLDEEQKSIKDQECEQQNKQTEQQEEAIHIEQQSQSNDASSFDSEQSTEEEQSVESVQNFTFEYIQICNAYPNVQEYDTSVCVQQYNDAYKIMSSGIQQNEEDQQPYEFSQVINSYGNVLTFEYQPYLPNEQENEDVETEEQPQESIIFENNQMLETIQGSDIKMEQTNQSLYYSNNEIEYIPVCNSYSFVQQYDLSEIARPVILSENDQIEEENQQDKLNPYQVIQQNVQSEQQQQDEKQHTVEDNDDHITIDDLQKQQTPQLPENKLQIDIVKDESDKQLANYQNVASFVDQENSQLQFPAQTLYSLGIQNNNDDQEQSFSIKVNPNASNNNSMASQ